MTPEQIGLLRESHSWVRPAAEHVAEKFYQRLFDICPEAEPLFTSDLKEQGRKLMATIATVVNSLEKLDALIPVVKELGVRHVDYGVTDEQYDQVGAALIWTFNTELGAKFTAAHQAAWVDAYGVLSKVMKDAAAHARNARQETPKAAVSG